MVWIELIFPMVVVGGGMALLTLLAPRFSTALFLSVVSIPFALLLMLSIMLGDCCPSETVTCATDQDRNIALLCIFVGASLANVIMWVVVVRHRPRNKEV